jgi:hypothetical protein
MSLNCTPKVVKMAEFTLCIFYHNKKRMTEQNIIKPVGKWAKYTNRNSENMKTNDQQAI